MPYTAPTVEDFKARYTAFDAVADSTVQAFLDDGGADTETWPDADRFRAVMLYTAHQLASQGLGAGTIAAGVTSFKSGTFSATISDSLASRTGLGATIYGRDYLGLARRNFAGPRMAWTPPTNVL